MATQITTASLFVGTDATNHGFIEDSYGKCSGRDVDVFGTKIHSLYAIDSTNTVTMKFGDAGTDLIAGVATIDLEIYPNSACVAPTTIVLASATNKYELIDAVQADLIKATLDDTLRCIITYNIT